MHAVRRLAGLISLASVAACGGPYVRRVCRERIRKESEPVLNEIGSIMRKHVAGACA
jgi:hypothetical protein